MVRFLPTVAISEETCKLLQGLVGPARMVLAKCVLLLLITYIIACFGIELITKSCTLQAESHAQLILGSKIDSTISTKLPLVQIATADSIGSICRLIVRQRPDLAAYIMMLLVGVTVLRQLLYGPCLA